MPDQSRKDSPRRAFLPVFLHHLVLTAGLFGLLLPSFGPLLDHHFAERQPHHTHLYLSPEALSHRHFYEAEHSHHHLGFESNLSPGGQPAPVPGNADVVYLTANDGAEHSPPAGLTTTLYVDIAYPALDGDHLLPGFSSQGTLPPESFVPPPEKPPPA